jgi:hypothetical protein
MKGKNNYWPVLAGSGKSTYFVLAGFGQFSSQRVNVSLLFCFQEGAVCLWSPSMKPIRTLQVSTDKTFPFVKQMQSYGYFI